MKDCVCMEIEDREWEVIQLCCGRKKCIIKAKEIIRESEDSKDN
jgi:hypothetical protein